MDHYQTELDVHGTETETVESLLKSFWEKVRVAADLIHSLRQENRGLGERISMVEKELQAMRSEMAAKEQEVKRLRAEQAQLMSSNGHEYFSGEEREILKGRIRELIAKINTHL